MTELEIIALNRLCILAFAALCVVLGAVISCKKLDHQGEVSANVGKCSLVLRSVHVGTVLIAMGAGVVIFLVMNPLSYKRSYANGEEITAEIMKSTESVEMAGSPIPKESKAK